MSLLLCDQYEDQAILVTDTLTLNHHDDTPSGFRSKVWTLPHMNMAIAMTGTANIGDAWYNHIVLASGATNIEELDTVTPASLRNIQAEIEKHYGSTDTSTVYHFGFPSGSDKLVRYTYRSKNDYEPETFIGCQYLAKPTPDGYQLQQPDDLDQTIRLALDLRDKCRMPSGALMIGGELFATRITNWGIQSARWYRFDDYDGNLQSAQEVQ